MKITKSQLKQLIKEELEGLKESEWDPDPKQALEDIYFESEFLGHIKDALLGGYLPPYQEETIEGLKVVVSNYLSGRLAWEDKK